MLPASFLAPLPSLHDGNILTPLVIPGNNLQSVKNSSKNESVRSVMFTIKVFLHQFNGFTYHAEILIRNVVHLILGL